MPSFDFNNNGIPDYKEPRVWLWFGGFVSKVIKFFAAQHTIAYKTAAQYEDAVKAYKDALGVGEEFPK